MIYLFRELDSFSEELFRKALDMLPPGRREYVLHFGQSNDQKRSAIDWLLLNYGLQKEYHISAPPEFLFAASGKPFLSGEHMPFFNFSHSGVYVACAVFHQDIGLDIQNLATPRDSLVRRVCTQTEFSSIHSPADFCQLWSMKESAAKLTGEGITGNFRDILALHPEMHTYTTTLTDPVAFLSYSIYISEEIPIQVISAQQLLKNKKGSGFIHT